MRICQLCGNDFTARTTVTQYCSNACSKRAYKARLRANKVAVSDKQTQLIRARPIEEIKAKEFLTVRDVAKLLSCSIRTAYRLIENKTVNAVNIAERKTLVKRSEVDKLFAPLQQNITRPESQETEFNENACYNLSEVQNKFGISEKALHELIKRNGISKIKKGLFAYVPKKVIDKILS